MTAGLVVGILIVITLAVGVYLLWYRKMHAEDKAGIAFADHLFRLENAGACAPELDVRLGALESRLEATYILVSHLCRLLECQEECQGDKGRVTFRSEEMDGAGGSLSAGASCKPVAGCLSLGDGAGGSPSAGAGFQAGPGAGNGVVVDSRHMPVYRAYDSGEGITQIARATGRSKGEIELILNLRRVIN